MINDHTLNQISEHVASEVEKLLEQAVEQLAAAGGGYKDAVKLDKLLNYTGIRSCIANPKKIEK